MDNSDIAAAALKENHRGPCNCRKRTRDGKPQRSCHKCNGTGTLTACGDCDGSGWNAAKQIACKKCEGNGYVQKPSNVSPIDARGEHA